MAPMDGVAAALGLPAAVRLHEICFLRKLLAGFWMQCIYKYYLLQQHDGGREGGRRDGAGAESATGARRGHGVAAVTLHLLLMASVTVNAGHMELKGWFCHVSPLSGVVSRILECAAPLNPSALVRYIEQAGTKLEARDGVVLPVPLIAHLCSYLAETNTQVVWSRTGFAFRVAWGPSLLLTTFAEVSRMRHGCTSFPAEAPPRSPRSSACLPAERRPRYWAD